MGRIARKVTSIEPLNAFLLWIMILLLIPSQSEEEDQVHEQEREAKPPTALCSLRSWGEVPKHMTRSGSTAGTRVKFFVPTRRGASWTGKRIIPQVHAHHDPLRETCSLSLTCLAFIHP